jgi:hypothetical protein
MFGRCALFFLFSALQHRHNNPKAISFSYVLNTCFCKYVEFKLFNKKITVRCTFDLLGNHLATTTNSSVLCTFYTTQEFICNKFSAYTIWA